MDQLLHKIRDLFPPGLHASIFLVGGSVRDSLMGLSAKDIDVLAAVPVTTLIQLGFRLICGKTTDPIWLKHDPALGNIEITRLDSVSEVENNLLRRDFTVNAMAMGMDGTLIDPLHTGQDLQQRVLRVCSDHVFHDDPLRIIRACRFATDGWQLSTDTEQLMWSENWSQQLAAIPVERFSREMVKALGGSTPSSFFQLMVSMVIGKHWLPELFKMPDIPAGPIQYHPEGDLLAHSLQVLQRVAELTDDPLTRFCAFFHDIGKFSTNPALYPTHHGHDEAGFKPALAFCSRLALPARWGTALAWISRLHTNLNRWDELRDGTKLRIAGQAQKAGCVEILPLVSAADKPGNIIPADWPRAVAISALNGEQLGIDVNWLMTMPVQQRSDLIVQKRIEWYRKGTE